MLKTLILSLGITYTVLLITIFSFQRKLIYLPGSVSPYDEARTLERLSQWPSEQHFRGWIHATPSDRHPGRTEPGSGNASAAGKKGTVIVFHGNAGAALHRTYYIDALEIRGLRVILAEYPGYGGRAGMPTETALVNDALETIRQAHQEFGEPIILWGESLGSGVISAAAARTSIPLAALVLFLPWDSLPAVAQHHYPWLPARWLVRDRYDTIGNLRSLRVPVAVLLAGRDEVVPPRHGERVFETLPPRRRRLWRFAGAGHNTVPLDAELPWWDEVVEFLLGPFSAARTGAGRRPGPQQ